MPKTYTCKLCKKEFKQKVDYDRHVNKKNPCVSIETLKKIVHEDKNIEDETKKLQTIFRDCLNVLRDCEHLTGDKALRTLAHLLILRLIEPQIGKEIDLDNFDYEFSEIKDADRKKMLSFARFSTIAKQKEENIPIIMKLVWNEILAQHPKTKYIFESGRGFDIKNQSTYCKLVDKISKFEFEDISADIQGHAYEEVIKDIMTGKVLGQFFTPTNVKKMMVELIDPVLYEDGTTETMFDPAMGTGGFLITSLRHIMKKSQETETEIDWDFVSKKGFGGREAEPDTYQLARANMLISTGHMFDAMEKGDSIRDPIIKKFDIVLANPPFGIKGLTYSDIVHELKTEYMPIKSNSAVPLFLQAIIYMLKINGRCAVIIPCGKELFKVEESLINTRKFLMKTCELKEVIELPSGVFTYTDAKTCILYFIKKRNGNEVVTVDVKYNKAQKEIKREYTFKKTSQTKKVKFYDYNPYTNVKNLLVKVPIDEIIENNYSLNYTEYLNKDNNITGDVVSDIATDIEIKILGEVCGFITEKHGTSFGKSEGKYKFHTGGVRTDLYVDEPDIKKLAIIINRTNGSGRCNIFLDKNFSCATQTIVFHGKTDAETKYIYYHLKYNIKLLENGYIGMNHKNISLDYVKNVKLVIPSIEKQNKIVEQMDFIHEQCVRTNNEKIIQLEQINKQYVELNVMDCDKKTLGDVIEIQNGKRIVKGHVPDGKYPVLGGGGETSFYTDTYTRKGTTCKISREGMSEYNCVQILKKKYYLNSQGMTVISNDENILLNKYLWYYLCIIRNKIYMCGRGTAQKAIDISQFKKISIDIPTLYKQNEIIAFCDTNEKLIETLKLDTKKLIQMAKQIITCT